METILVRIAEPGDGRVALWERHPAHPNGEVFLVGEGEFEVALTPAVETRLRSGKLVASPAPAKATTVKPELGETGPAAAEDAPPPAGSDLPDGAEHKPARAARQKPPRPKGRTGGL